MANDDPPTPPGPPGNGPAGEGRPGNAGHRSGGHRRGRGPKGEPHPRKPRLPQRDVAEDEPVAAEGAADDVPEAQAPTRGPPRRRTDAAGSTSRSSRR